MVQSIEDYATGIFSFAITPNGKFLVTGERLGAVRIWDISTGIAVGRFAEGKPGNDPNPVEALNISPDGTLLAAGGSGAYIRIWELNSRSQLHGLVCHGGGSSDVAFSPDSSTIISTYRDGTIYLCDVDAGSERKIIKGHSRDSNGLALAQETEFLTADDQTIRVWDWKTGNSLGVLERADLEPQDTVRDVDFNNNIKLVAVEDVYRVQVWTAEHDPWEKLHEFTSFHYDAEGLAFSPLGDLLAFGSSEGWVKIMDTHTGHILVTLELPASGNIFGIKFSPDGRILAVASSNGEVQLWGIVGNG